MRFINPKTDFAFKKIFGSPQSKEILISFLNAILYDGKPTIKDLEIIDPYLAPKIQGVKDTYLDVRAFLSGGQKVIIEMQVLNVAAIEKRILYNAAKSYSLQLDKGEKYHLLNPVIALTITDFKMFEKSEEIISWYVLKEKERLTDYPESDLELVFVELPKFHKKLEELSDIKDKWMYFLKYCDELSEIPEPYDGISEFTKAFEIANKANMSKEELEDLERREIFIQDQIGGRKLAFNKGRTEGRTEGIQEGQLKLLMLLLSSRFGAIAPEIENRVAQLSAEELQNLAVAAFNFSSIQDLVAWLDNLS